MWYYSVRGDRQGPISTEDLKAFISKGTLTADTQVWQEGMNDWKRAFEVPELGLVVPPLPPALPETPKLWNPNAASLMSFILTPLFGGLLVSKNWQTLGNEKKAKVSLIWVVVYGVLALVHLFAAIPGPFFLLALVLWHLLDAVPQIKFIKKTFPGGYQKRRWNQPLVYWAAGFCGYLILVALFTLFESDPASRVKTGHLYAFGDSVAVGEVFDVVSGGSVEWESSEIAENIPEAKTHLLVEASWYNDNQQKVTIQFLTEKNGDEFFLHGAEIAGEWMEAEPVIEGLASVYLQDRAVRSLDGAQSR
jgi:hypothetical protein